MAILIKLAKGLPEVEQQEDEPVIMADGSAAAAKTSIFQFPNLMLGVAALFCYVGVEVIAGDTIISYGVSLGLSLIHI